MEDKDVFGYITTEENNFKTVRVPLTSSKDWNMAEHIERCTNVVNGWFHKGANDGLRPYNDIVTPIVDVAFRSEGFDVKDIVPYVDSAQDFYKSFLVKKYHPQWARKHHIDTFIDEVVETSIIYDLVLVKNINNARPEVVDLKTIAFCDQTDVMASPICIKHQYTVAELVDFKDKWDAEKIDMAIVLAPYEKEVSTAGDQVAKTPSKYVEVYELRGNLPEKWLKDGGERFKYAHQMHIVCFYKDENGEKQGLTLYKGKDKPLSDNFKALKIDAIRSKGRACGRSVVERLFEPQVWRNYSGIKLKKMLDGIVNILQTDSEELANQKISELKDNTILKHEAGKPITRVDMSLQNIVPLQNYSIEQENSAQKLGSATDGQLGKNPVSGTPFALENLVVQQGEGIHEYRRGKIATFFSDVLYQDWILEWLVRDMNGGKEFSEELTLEEMKEIGEVISDNMANQKIKEMILDSGTVPSAEEMAIFKEVYLEQFMKEGNRKFMKVMKDELSKIPVKVKVNVAGKQRYMAQNADKLSKLITTFLGTGVPISVFSKQINELLEESGMSPVNFSEVIKSTQQAPEGQAKEIESPVGENELESNQVLA